MKSPQFNPDQKGNLKATHHDLKQKHGAATETFRNKATVENEIKMKESHQHLRTFETAGFRGLHLQPGSYNRSTDGLNARHEVVESRRELRDSMRAANVPHQVKRGAQEAYNLAKTHLKAFKNQHSRQINNEKTIRQQTSHIQEPPAPPARPRTPETPVLRPQVSTDSISSLGSSHSSASSSSSSSSGFSASEFPPGVRPSTADNYKSGGSSSERPVLPNHEQLSRLKDHHGSTKGTYYGMKNNGSDSRADIHNARAEYLGAKDSLDTFRKENKGALKAETAQQGRFNKLEKEFGKSPLGGLPPPESPFGQRPAPTPVRPGTPSIPIGPREFDRLSSLPGFNPGGPGGFSPNYPTFTSSDVRGNTQIHSGPEALPPRNSGGPTGPSENALGKRPETASTAQPSSPSAQGSSSRPHAGMSWEQLNTQMRSSHDPQERAGLKAEIDRRIQSGSGQ